MLSPHVLIFFTINEEEKKDQYKNALSEEDYVEFLGLFEVKDSITIINKYCKELFKNKKETSIENYLDIIPKSIIGYLLKIE